jgi:hypothetical protein
MTLYLGAPATRSQPFTRLGHVRYRRRTFDCYKSRADGEGWDYHCMTAADAYDVDVGAGRRPYRISQTLHP